MEVLTCRIKDVVARIVARGDHSQIFDENRPDGFFRHMAAIAGTNGQTRVSVHQDRRSADIFADYTVHVSSFVLSPADALPGSGDALYQWTELAEMVRAVVVDNTRRYLWAPDDVEHAYMELLAAAHNRGRDDAFICTLRIPVLSNNTLVHLYSGLSFVAIAHVHPAVARIVRTMAERLPPHTFHKLCRTATDGWRVADKCADILTSTNRTTREGCSVIEMVWTRVMQCIGDPAQDMAVSVLVGWLVLLASDSYMTTILTVAQMAGTELVGNTLSQAFATAMTDYACTLHKTELH